MKAFCERAIAYIKAATPIGGSAGAVPPGAAPVLREFCEGLVVSYVVDQDGQFVYVQERHLEAAGMQADTLHHIGLANLAARADGQVRVQRHGPVCAVFFDGNFEASLMLLDDVWENGLAGLVQHGYTVTAPARDILAFCDADSRDGATELRQIVARVAGGDHLLTPNLYRREGKRWVVVR